ncbi:MAG: ribonuclease R [Parcubacteria group bacterium 21-54-25]|nr:MAG: ribonuclease R [Parcubacteria group bacterium 21-54-25]HQU07553.1 ribonuclease R [Candidatus Paceibacterota bacterium]
MNPDQKNSKTHEGIIQITRRGTGFFSLGEDKKDLMIPREWLGGAFPLDVVRIEEAGVIENRSAAKVVGIVERVRTTFVGTLSEENGRVLLLPDWKRMYTPFAISGEHLPLGHKVLVRFTHWNAGEEFPTAVIEEDIGTAGVHETEMRALVLGEGFRPGFPPGVEKEAAALEQGGRARIDVEIARGTRRDFRDVTTFTIDPIDAKDFDDALSVRDLGDGKTEVGIHIADVSFFVTPGTPIDREARDRATSVYLVDRTIPMLPEVLSNDLCSLRPNENRLAVSAVLTLDANATIIDRWFGETVIHSDKRFTYEAAQEVLDNSTGEFHAELLTLRTLAQKIRARRIQNGAIEFDTAEVKIELDDAGAPVAIRLKERKDTNLLIEDFMLAANVAVAEHLAEASKKRGLTRGFIYRIHDAPDADRIENLSLFLRVLGYHLDTHAGHVKGTDLNALMEKVVGTPEEYLVKTAALRSMAKAIYSTKNVGHFGLAFQHYTHFTSPIRRYPDLSVHRILKQYAEGTKIPEQTLAAFETLAIHASEREVAATHAERDSIKMKQVEFLAKRIGEEFDAVISGVTERGLFVEEQTTRADGMIRISTLGDDYFDYDEKRYRLVGRRTKKAFTLGDPIRVKLIAARIADRELDFSLGAKSDTPHHRAGHA